METSIKNYLLEFLTYAKSIQNQSSSISLEETLKSLNESDYFSLNPIPGFSYPESQEIVSELINLLKKQSNIPEKQENIFDQSEESQFTLTRLCPSDMPLILIHGTSKSAFKSIKSRGLFKMQRNFIYFSSILPEPKKSFERSKTKNEVFVYLDMEKCLNFFEFFVLNSSVILTKGKSGFVSPFFFYKVLINRIERPFLFSPPLFDYFIVIDLDATCCESRKLDCQEIIEFPAEIVNSSTLETEFKFHRYVKPSVFPLLTQFCVDFTGVTQDIVDQSEDILKVLQDFQEFLKNSGIFGKKWIFTTCGDWDLGVCFKKELEYKRVQVPKVFTYWLSIKKMIPGFKKGDVLDVCKYLDVEPSGRRHCGKDDCFNTANCLKALLNAKVLINREDISGNIENFDELMSS